MTSCDIVSITSSPPTFCFTQMGIVIRLRLQTIATYLSNLINAQTNTYTTTRVYLTHFSISNMLIPKRSPCRLKDRSITRIMDTYRIISKPWTLLIEFLQNTICTLNKGTLGHFPYTLINSKKKGLLRPLQTTVCIGFSLK